MTERRLSGATHSFRLWPRASDIMDSHPAIRPHSKYNGKSAHASRAIEWYFTSPILGREIDDLGEFTGYWVKKTHGTPTPIELILENDSLRKEILELQFSLENRTSLGGVLRGLLGKK